MKKKLTFGLLITLLMATQSGYSQNTVNTAPPAATNQNQSNAQAVVNNVVNYADNPLNVDGQFTDELPQSDSELDFINSELQKQKRQIYLSKEKTKKYGKLKNSTEKLVGVTEEYVEERRDSEKLIKEYNEKINCLLEKNYANPNCDKYAKRKKVIVDQVVVKEAAPPRRPVVIETPRAKFDRNYNFNDKFKVMIGLGTKNYTNGRNFDNFDSNILFNIGAESEVGNRLALGLKFDYNSLNFLYTQEYRPVSTNSFGLEFYGKFLLLQNTRFRPYIGAGLGFNRFNLRFDDNFNNFGNFYNNNAFYGNGNNFNDFNDSYSTNSFQASLMLGAEFIFSRNVGFYTNFSYLRGLTDFGGDNYFNNNLYYEYDRDILSNLHDNIVNSQAFSVVGGMIISF